MAVLKTKVIWYQSGVGEGVELTDVESIQVKRGAKPKSNSMTIKLKNAYSNEKGGLSHVDSEGDLKFQEDDIIKIYAKVDSNNEDLDESATSADLLMTAEIKDIDVVSDNKNTRLGIKAVDRTYSLLNRVWAFSFLSDSDQSPNGEGWTAPEIVQNIIRNTTDNSPFPESQLFDMYGNMPPSRGEGGPWEIDARMFKGGEGNQQIKTSGTSTTTSAHKLIDTSGSFESLGVKRSDNVFNSTDRIWATVKSVDSETQLTLTKDIFVSGESYEINDAFIQHKRPDLGTPDTDTDLFPDSNNANFHFVGMAKAYKPAYEWLSELSQVEYCNTVDEADDEDPTATLSVRRAMRYYIDERNRFHWFYPHTTPELWFTEGTTSAVSPDTQGHKIIETKGKLAVYDIVNFIIFRAGIDMNGAQILGYELDRTSTSLSLKSSYRPFVKIAEHMKRDDENAGNITKSTQGDSIYYSYPGSYPVTPVWDDSQREVSSDSEYNTNFREIAQKRGKARARAIIEGSLNPTWKLDVAIIGENLTPSDLVRFNSGRLGIKNKNMRINEVTHNIDKNGWRTTLKLEEEAEEQE